MTSDDVTDGCAAVGYVLASCEICATSFRLKKITGRLGIQHHAVKTYAWLRFAARGVPSLPRNLSRITSRVSRVLDCTA